jgi:cytochrome c biogenesis factor
MGNALRVIAGHRMRGYYIALIGGAMLVASSFLPLVLLGSVGLGGIPGMASVWVLSLGVAAILLASLSIYTRKNSRHPLLVVGLISLAILVLAYQWMRRTAVEQAWARSQALSIVDQLAPGQEPETAAGLGVYIGLIGAIMLVLFGLTIVIRRVARPYAEPEDDDI